MNKFTSFIIDDEKQARRNLRYLINNYIPEVYIHSEFDCVKKAIPKIHEQKPDVIFLDVQMPELSGIEFLQLEEDRTYQTILVTAHNGYGIDAVKCGVLDYVLKPISIYDLRNAVEKLKKVNSVREGNCYDRIESNKIKIAKPNGFSMLDTDDIVYLEAENNYTRIYTKSAGRIISCKTLKEFENVLNSNRFLRVHKSFIINLSYFKEFNCHDGFAAELEGDISIEVSRRKVPELKEAIQNHYSIA
jgi:two-component system, LytTR family, response regulator